MKRHEAQLHSSETPYQCRSLFDMFYDRCSVHFMIKRKYSKHIEVRIKTLAASMKYPFSRCDRTFKSEYSWKRHQSNDEVHQKMENFTPFLTCEVNIQFSFCVFNMFRFVGSSLRGEDGGVLTSTCWAMRQRGDSTVISVENTSGTHHIWKPIGRPA